MRFCVLAPCCLAAALSASPAVAENLLVNGSFEKAGPSGIPAGWEIATGARTADAGKTSTCRVMKAPHDGRNSLFISGDATTSEWLMLRSRPVKVEPGQKLRLSGWIRTDQVHVDGSQYRNCNLGVTFTDYGGQRIRVGGYPVVGTRPLMGSNYWTKVERVIEVPPEAATANVTAFLSMTGRAWFDEVELEPVDAPVWKTTETARFRFHYQTGSEVPEWARKKNEKNLSEMEQALGLRMSGKIDFYHYRNNDQKRALTGNGGNAHVEGDHTLHTVWRVDRHEMVHLLMRRLGEAESPLLGEGIAVYLAGPWRERNLDDWVRDYAKEGTLPPLSSLVSNQSFRGRSDMVTYPVSGSFAGWLIETYGMERLQKTYPRQGNLPDEERFRTHLRRTYGMPLEDLESAWLASLGIPSD
jgi:hypothetical protein